MTTATLSRTAPTPEYFENELFIFDPASFTSYSQDWREKSKKLDEIFARRKRERQLTR